MATVKTAISLDQELFRKANRAARKERLSRSRLVAKALEAYLQRLENQELLERINDSCDAELADEDRAFLRAARRKTGRRLRADEW